jgi:hypothetical protein
MFLEGEFLIEIEHESYDNEEDDGGDGEHDDNYLHLHGITSRLRNGSGSRRWIQIEVWAATLCDEVIIHHGVDNRGEGLQIAWVLRSSSIDFTDVDVVAIKFDIDEGLVGVATISPEFKYEVGGESRLNITWEVTGTVLIKLNEALRVSSSKCGEEITKCGVMSRVEDKFPCGGTIGTWVKILEKILEPPSEHGLGELRGGTTSEEELGLEGEREFGSGGSVKGIGDTIPLIGNEVVIQHSESSNIIGSVIEVTLLY